MALTENIQQFDELTKNTSPKKILSVWTALEVLSPQTFDAPEDLAPGGDKKLIAKFNNGLLPWEQNDLIEPPKNTTPFYEIVLGIINLDEAVKLLLDKYIDARVERQKLKSEAIIATIIVDKAGVPIKENAANISSFAWGISVALNGKLCDLAAWPDVERGLIERLDAQIKLTDDNGESLPLNFEAITSIFNWYTSLIEIPSEIIKLPYFALRKYQSVNGTDSPEQLVLNSFFLKDLSEAQSLFANNNANDNLNRYLGVKNHSHKIDLLKDNKALMDALSPTNMPLSRWPGKGRHPLVLLQQAAVNLVSSELDTGILAINGPPGTGKTTLLRDLVADIVTKRALALAKFSNPTDAFKKTSERIEYGQKWTNIFELHDTLKGFEIIIASSNNKAVENVSTELPGLDAIASDAEDLRYFKTISDQLLNQNTWGLISAALGNAKNKQKFKEIFYWHKDFGFETYLSAAMGKPKFYKKMDPKTKEIIEERAPLVVTNENPPRNYSDALKRWHKCRKEFNELQKLMDERITDLNKLKTIFEKFTLVLKNNEKEQEEWMDVSHYEFVYDELMFEITNSKFIEKAKIILSRNFIKTSYLRWKYNKKLGKLLSVYALAHNKYKEVLDKICTKIPNFDQHLIDYLLFDKEHKEQQVTSPWFTKETQLIRDELFTVAINLHKAFIDACAYPIKSNLSVLMNVFSGNQLMDLNKAKLMPDIWSTFFLIVPSISTTFASIDRMFPKIPPNTFGWLLIDEAGQALPQAAVGALMRTKRAVVVGDPLQIEPVVALPETLTKAICKEFEVDPDRFNAPVASVQTLADQATKYNTQIGDVSSRVVGVPLLVHRRCDEPMFSISNTIAYEGLMVNAKTKGSSPIQLCLGNSSWFDIQGNPSGKWCLEEGQMVLNLLQKLKSSDILPNLYIISPFLMVAQNLQMMVRDSKILHNWVENKNWCNERIGTVHTAQGREAEAIILVLGAPSTSQIGARNWAGNKPNILNVAVTRAKEVIYVVGNRDLWRDAGLFKELDIRIN